MKHFKRRNARGIAKILMNAPRSDDKTIKHHIQKMGEHEDGNAFQAERWRFIKEELIKALAARSRQRRKASKLSAPTER